MYFLTLFKAPTTFGDSCSGKGDDTDTDTDAEADADADADADASAGASGSEVLLTDVEGDVGTGEDDDDIGGDCAIGCAGG